MRARDLFPGPHLNRMSTASHAFEVDPIGPPVTGRAPDIDLEPSQWSAVMTTLVPESTVDDIVVDPAPSKKARRLFPWVVFTLTFALLLSDYMSRQVLSAVFPFLKLEWALTDTQLGGLVSVVSLTVAVLAVPLSLLGDRWGRVKSIVLMATIWSLATLGSALAANYEQLMLARVFIGAAPRGWSARSWRHRRPSRRSSPASTPRSPIPRRPLPFPSIVATSDDDPLSNPVRLRALATAWGSRLHALGAVGHLNPASGYGDWPGAVPLMDELRRASDRPEHAAA